MVVEKDINGLDFIYENKDELAFEPDPNQLEPIEDEQFPNREIDRFGPEEDNYDEVDD